MCDPDACCGGPVYQGIVLISPQKMMQIMYHTHQLLRERLSGGIREGRY